MKSIKQNSAITLVALVITIIIIIILAGVTITITIGENGLIKKVQGESEKVTQEKRIEELELLATGYSFKEKLTDPIATIDFVQPFVFNEYSEMEIKDYVKTLKRAGYKELIVQNIMNISGGENSNVSISAAWYDSNLITNTSDLELYRPNVLRTLINAIEENDMKIYVGLAQSNDWWNDNFKNTNWRNNNTEFYNSIIDEIYEKYGDLDCFAGWYWTFEMYPNNKSYHNYWAEMINNNIQHINLIDNDVNKHRIIISPFVSTLYDMDEVEISNQWNEMITKINFRNNDVICMQDCLGTSDFDPSKVLTYIKEGKKAVEKDDRNLQFWINVECYVQNNNTITTAPFERYKAQLEICALFAKELASFSYSHYYNPNVIDNNDLDKKYRQYYASVTGETKYTIDIPRNGSVYEDKNGKEVPVPANFKVSETENTVDKGLVISDSFGNEYVWIPVEGGVKEKGHTYSGDEYKIVYYTRYIKNGIDISNTTNDTLPVGVLDDKNQIKKYGGFYIGRYESSYNYNNGTHAAQTKYNSSNKATTSFSWNYADSDIYTGYLLNSINYTDAKRIAENMSSVYNYVGVKTGLVNGTQWDTMLKWFHSNDETYTIINDGTTWGNYANSESPATEGNYVKDEIKPSGSNENWKYLNIYDVAGNLAEWTSEISSGNAVLRSVGYNGNGKYGSPSYGWSAESYQYPNVGFRVVLYID